MQASGNLHTTCTRTDLTGVQQSTGQNARKQTKLGQGPYVGLIPRRSLWNLDPIVTAVTVVISVATPDDSA